MVLSALLCATLVPNDEIELARVFTKGQKLSYEVKSHIMTEFKSGEMAFYLPQEFDVNYTFTMAVQEAKPDGFAVVLYERPSMTFIDGETAESPPKSKVEKVGLKYKLNLSPINEITEVTDLNPKKDEKKKDGDKSLRLLAPAPAAQDSIVGNMVRELNSLALFTGSIDSSLDFSPKLPLDAVKPGDTWKKTVSYQPRQIKGTEKQAVQRLDYTFTYDGLADSNGQKVHRITASLDLDTDAAKFLNQVMGTKPEESGLSELRLKMKNKITFDLDLKTLTTLRANGESTGGFTLTAKRDGDEQTYDEKITGRSSMKLVSNTAGG